MESSGQATASKYGPLIWRKAISRDLHSLPHNGTFRTTELHGGRNAASNKWVFKVQSNADCAVSQFKTRLVAQDFSQRPRVDYSATFSPLVVKLGTLRTCLALAAHCGMHIHLVEIETANLKEDIYMKQPK